MSFLSFVVVLLCRIMEVKEKILSQTFDLIMKYGIKSVSMDDISRSIGISKKTVYQYFENKRTLISQVISEHMAKDEAEIRQIMKEAENALEEIVNVARHTLVFLRGLSPSMIYDVRKYYPIMWNKIESEHFLFIYQVIKSNIDRGQQEGLYHTDLNSNIISRLYIQETLAVIDENIFPLSEYKRSDLFKTMITYHIRALMSDKGRQIAEHIELD